MCPDIPMIYVLMGFVHQLEYWLGIGQSPRESIEKGIEMVQKAIAMDDSVPIAHGLLGHFYSLKREHDKAIAEGERAVVLEPGGEVVHGFYGTSLNFAGRSETGKYRPGQKQHTRHYSGMPHGGFRMYCHSRNQCRS